MAVYRVYVEKSPEYAVEASLAADEATHAKYNWLVDQKPVVSAEGCADGTYEVTRLGINGPMEFVIEIAGDKITDVTVASHNEVENFGTRAIDQVPGEIVAASSLDVDLVSGAGTQTRPGRPDVSLEAPAPYPHAHATATSFPQNATP